MQTNITEAELLSLEYDQCKRDPLYWLTNYGYIRDERTGAEHGPGLRLWPGTADYPLGQLEYAAAYCNGSDIEMLKARQLGASWIAENLDAWDLMFSERVRLAIIDKSEPDSWDHITRIKLIYDRQPEYLKLRKPYRGKDSKGEFALGNADDYSVIRSYPCTAGAVRGPAVKRVRLEEYAFYQNATAVITAVNAATADTGGQVVGITTGNGEGTVHHRRWRSAQSGESGATAIFWPWDMHPDRDADWYGRTRSKYGSDAAFRQEFPSTPDEAFIAAGTKYYNAGSIDSCYRSMAAAEQPWPGWNIYVPFAAGASYVIFADPADAGGDGCSADVLVRGKAGLEQVAHIHSYEWSASAFADQLATLGEKYGNALLAVERNNHGHSVIERLKSTHKYLNLYMHSDGKLGYPTDSVTRPLMLDGLGECMNELGVIIHDAGTCAELKAFAWIKGRPEAPEGMHDDRVFSLAGAVRLAPAADAGRWNPQARHAKVY